MHARRVAARMSLFFSRPPRLRTVLLAVNLVLVLLIVEGAVLLHLYDSALVRRTEGELIAQAAVVASAYRGELRQALATGGVDRETYGLPCDPRFIPSAAALAEPYAPIVPKLDLARDTVAPAPEPACPAAAPADAAALAAAQRLGPVLSEAQRVTLAGARVLDFHGIVVATSRSELGLSLAHRDEVQRALRGEFLTLMRQRESDDVPPLDSPSRRSRLRVYVVAPVVEGDRVWGAVLVSRTPMDVVQSLYGIRWYLAAGAVSVAALMALLAAFTSRAITRPVAELIRRAESVRRGDATTMAPLKAPGTLELERLSIAVAAMARALDERATYIGAFAASVSHEFKTPLAAIHGAVELLRDHLDEMSAAERERFLGNIAEDTARLDRLVRSLMDLARADVLRPGDERAAVEPLLRQLAARFGDLSLAVTAKSEDGGASARMAAETLETILTNLLDNARRHGGADVRVVVTTRREERDGKVGVAIAVSDDGPGISAANQARVFDRFFTTARASGGTGLGLAIVKALVEAHHGEIALESRPGETVFTVWLPI